MSPGTGTAWGRWRASSGEISERVAKKVERSGRRRRVVDWVDGAEGSVERLCSTVFAYELESNILGFG